MLNKDQNQDVGNGSSAIQAGGNVTVVSVGVSATEARAIALDVAKTTFYELTGEAKETAKVRAEEITEKVIEKLEKEYSAGLQKAKDPDFQYALYNVQKEYARNGDKNLGDLLVDLLVDRSKQDQRDILQIVLNESIETAPKLTQSQLSSLAIIFLFKYTVNHSIGNHEQLGKYFDQYVSPFALQLAKSDASYQHLEFAGCGSIQMGEVTLEKCLTHTYGGQFTTGFDAKEIEDRAISVGNDQRFFVPCLNDPSKIQVRANNKEILKENLIANNIGNDDQTKISALFDVGMMSADKIREKCIEIRPYMKPVFDTWSNSSMKKFTLTSVGMAIGHANVKRMIGREFAPLSIWIN